MIRYIFLISQQLGRLQTYVYVYERNIESCSISQIKSFLESHSVALSLPVASLSTSIFFGPSEEGRRA